MRLYITIILFLILLVIAVIFGSQNEQMLTLNYVIAKQDMPVATAVSLFTMIGFVLGLLFSLFLKFIGIFKSKKRPLTEVKKS